MIDDQVTLWKTIQNWLQPPQPLVSVIITSYNHGHFLAEAIDSVLTQKWEPDSLLAQTENPVEIVVVDDGSTDDTRKVATDYKTVRYVFQKNQGLSAARNTGIRESRGEFLIFLDADDWLYPDAISIGFEIMTAEPELAFVSGASNKVDLANQFLSEKNSWVPEHHYCRLLEENYIGMHATVMYRRAILEQYKFDTTLRACEDYDLYLRIAREFPVSHHQHKVAAYRIHHTNMSADIPMMLQAVLNVLERQKNNLRNDQERQAYRQGIQNWKDYYENLGDRRLQGG